MISTENLEQINKFLSDYKHFRDDLTFKVKDFEEREKDANGKEISTSNKTRYEVRNGARFIFMSYDKERADQIRDNINHSLENFFNAEESFAVTNIKKLLEKTDE